MRQFFSVVVPLYNKEYSIQRCIDSILAQTHNEYEIIIVNDGSTDNSLGIVSKIYHDWLLRGTIVLVNQQNFGVSVARNNGVKIADSDYICFLDADDEWDSGFLEAMNNLIRDYPDAALYCVGHKIDRGNGKIETKLPNLQRDHRGYIDDFFSASIRGDVANSSKVCVRKGALVAINGFPEGVVCGEDYHVWIMLALTTRVAYEDKAYVVLHAQQDRSRSSRKNSVPYPFIYFSTNKHMALTTSLRKYLLVIFYKHFGMSLLKCRPKEAALRLFYFLRALF